VELKNAPTYCEEIQEENVLITLGYTSSESKTSVSMGKDIYERIINLPGEKRITEEELVLTDESNTDDHFKGSPDHKHDSDRDDDEKGT
jgi:hypothetical protein